MLTATANRIGSSLAYEVDVNGRHAIVTDEPDALGGTDTGPAPHELLPAALASCIGTMIAMYAERRGWDVDEVSVEVAYDTESTPRRCEIAVHVPDDLSDDRRRQLAKVAETCPLRRALEAGFVFEERLVSGSPRLAAAPAS